MYTCPVCRCRLSDADDICPDCGVVRDDRPLPSPPPPPPSLPPAPAPRPERSPEPEWRPPPRWEPPYRPGWVYLIVGVYVLLAFTVTFGPVLIAAFGGSCGGVFAALIYAIILVACGASLVAIPIRAARDLPTTQRSIWLPLLCSATLAAILYLGFAFAAHEYTFGENGDKGGAAMRTIWLALPVVWFGWAVVFGVMAFRVGPERFAGRLYKSLLAGSALELLVAIPMHMVVRQRPYCCAGFGTGLGIGIGILVMLVALGPAIVFLFYRRYKDAYGRRR